VQIQNTRLPDTLGTAEEAAGTRIYEGHEPAALRKMAREEPPPHQLLAGEFRPKDGLRTEKDVLPRFPRGHGAEELVHVLRVHERARVCVRDVARAVDTPSGWRQQSRRRRRARRASSRGGTRR
jgi:hypothetical protein